MAQLIVEARRTFPLDAPEASVCADECRGCSLKLLEFLQSELENWEARLHDGEKPTLGDLHKLGNTCRKLYAVLEKNGLVAADSKR